MVVIFRHVGGKLVHDYAPGYRALPLVRQASRVDAAALRRDRIAGAHLRLHATTERAFLRAQATLWRRITETVLSRLKRAGTTSVQVDELFQPAEFGADFNRALRPVWSTAIFTGIQFEADWIGQRVASQSLSRMGRQDLAADELTPPPSFRVELSREMEGRIKSYLRERQAGVWSQVGQSTHDRLRRALARGLKEGDSFDGLEARIRDVMKSQSDMAARRIARTETTGSMNFGQQIERDDIGIEMKSWIATLDGVTRGVDPTDRFNHIDADGQVVANDAPFVVSGQRLMHPADGSMGASAGNIINCRCVGAADFGNEKLVPDGGTQPRTPATSVEELEQQAVDGGLADVADYQGLSLETAKALNVTLEDRLKQIPELRPYMEFIGSSQRRNLEAVQRMIERRRKQLADGRLAPSEIAAEMRKYRRTAARQIKKDYPIAPGDIAQFALPGHAAPAGITINAKEFGRLSQMERLLGEAVESGHLQPTAASFSAVIDHEIGHALDHLVRLTSPAGEWQDQELRTFYSKLTLEDVANGLSRYATSSNAEFVAEAYSEWRNSPKPRPIAAFVGGLIEERLNQLRKKT